MQIDGSPLLVCDLGHGLSEFCTKAFQEWYAVTYSVLSDRIIWECMCCCIMYNCISVYGWSFPQVALWHYLKLCFLSLGGKYFQFYLISKNLLIDCLSFFFGLHFLGSLFFVCFVLGVFFLLFFCNAASPKACWELSAHYASCFVAIFLQWAKGWVGREGGWVCMALSLSVYCTFLSFDISIAQPIVFFELHFDFDIPNISYIITVFSFQCNAFLRHLHPLPEGTLRWKSAMIVGDN